MTRFRRAHQLLKKTRETAQDATTQNLTEVMQILLDDRIAEKRKTSDANVAPNAVRRVHVHTQL